MKLIKFSALFLFAFVICSCSEDIGLDEDIVDPNEDFTFIGEWTPTKGFVTYDLGPTYVLNFEDGCDSNYDYCESLQINADSTALSTETSVGQISFFEFTYSISSDSIKLCLVEEEGVCFSGVLNEDFSLQVKSRHPDNDYYGIVTYLKEGN